MVAVLLGLAPATSSPAAATRNEAATPVTDLSPPPKVTARGWLVYDVDAEEAVAGVAATTPRPIASLAKLMTALVVSERVDPDAVVTIPRVVDELPADAARMDARAGERWPASQLLQAMLVYSANDAALALAAHVTDGDIPAFVELMNQRAEELGLDATRFASPTGLDTPGQSNTSTPLDLVELARTVLDVDALREAVALPSLTLERPNGGKLDPLPNRNPLLGSYAGVDGVKTGFTDAAGYMLVVHQLDAATGGDLLVATFASTTEKTRVRDARALLDWARSLRTEVRAVEGGTPLGSIPVRDGPGRVDVFACDDLLVTARVGQHLVQEVVVPRSLPAPVREGDEVGELRMRVGSQEPVSSDEAAPADAPASVPVCAADDVRKLGTLDRIAEHARGYREAWEAGVDEVDDAWNSLRRRLG